MRMNCLNFHAHTHTHTDLKETIRCIFSPLCVLQITFIYAPIQWVCLLSFVASQIFSFRDQYIYTYTYIDVLLFIQFSLDVEISLFFSFPFSVCLLSIFACLIAFVHRNFLHMFVSCMCIKSSSFLCFFFVCLFACVRWRVTKENVFPHTYNCGSSWKKILGVRNLSLYHKKTRISDLTKSKHVFSNSQQNKKQRTIRKWKDFIKIQNNFIAEQIPRPIATPVDFDLSIGDSELWSTLLKGEDIINLRMLILFFLLNLLETADLYRYHMLRNAKIYRISEDQCVWVISYYVPSFFDLSRFPKSFICDYGVRIFREKKKNYRTMKCTLDAYDTVSRTILRWISAINKEYFSLRVVLFVESKSTMNLNMRYKKER